LLPRPSRETIAAMNKHTMGFVVAGYVAAACSSSASGGAASATETTPSSDTKHQVVIARPAAPGQRLRLEVKATENVAALALEDDANSDLDIEGVTEDREVTLTGDLEIREVGERGEVHRAELVVERFYDELGKRDVLPPGAKMLATRDGEEFAVVVDGQLPTEDIASWLRLAFPLGRPGGALVSDALTPASPKAVGESWEIAKSEVVSDLGGDGYETTETAVTGEVTLVGTASCGVGQCLELSGVLRVQEATATESWDLTSVEGAVVDGKARLLLPIDPQLPVFLEDAESAATFVAGVKDEVNGTTARARIQVTRRRVASYVPLS